MPIRKSYEHALELIDEFKSELAKCDEHAAVIAGIKKRYDVAYAKAKKAGEAVGAKMASMKPHEAEFKKATKEFEKWESDYDKWSGRVNKLHSEVDDLAVKITDALKEKAKDEFEHIQKHRQRIVDAKKRVEKAITTKLETERVAYDQALAAKIKKQKELAAQGKQYDEADDPKILKTSPTTKLGFDKATRQAQLEQIVKLNSAESKAVEAAEKRIEVYEKIRAKKLKKYEGIRESLIQFRADFRIDKI